MKTKQRKARARAKKLKRQRLEREAKNVQAKKVKRWQDFGVKSTSATVDQSLEDLLPEGSTWERKEDGSIVITSSVHRGKEAEYRENIAKVLNIDEEHLGMDVAEKETL